MYLKHRRNFTGAYLLFSALATLVVGSSLQAAKVEKSPFGKTPDGQQVEVYTLRNASGMEVKVATYGATITSVTVPDRQKKMADVVLGFKDVSGYTAKTNTAFFGASIGRYGNRIGNAKFSIDGKEYHTPANDGPNTLHGGPKGFDKHVWTAKDVSGANPAVELQIVSPDGDQGFPGKFTETVRYTLGADNDLRIDYSAQTDKPTVLNLTNHSYFNLAGAGTKTVLDHRIQLSADRFTPVNETLIPTGVLQPVKGTPFDFRSSTRIGDHIDENDQQLKYAKGYDHNFVLNTGGDLKKVAAVVTEPTSGRVLEVFTDQPGIQFYTGNFLDGANEGIGGKYGYRSALCLETQHFPDSPNHPSFPSALLRPGQQFHSTTIYKFSVK
ncbi:MAG: aldose epimerase family protein [Bryobacteraceae bacterium]